MIPTGDLTAMQTTLTASLPDTCQVRRNTPVTDGAGGETDAWANQPAVTCRVSPLARSDRLAEIPVADRIAAVSSWIITLPAGTDVTEKDQLLSGGRTFQVASVLGPRSWEIGRRVLVQQVK